VPGPASHAHSPVPDRSDELFLTPPFHSPASRRQLSIVALAVLLIAAAAMAFGGDGRIGDEWEHYQQVQWFAAGRYAVVDGLTTIPGLHAFVAAVQLALHVESLGSARIVTMLFGALAAIAFASIRRALAPDESPGLATLQFAFFPTLFPFCFLLYTDVPSLALVLSAFRCSLDRRHVLAGALGVASLLVRQTNVGWIAFIALLQVLELRAAAGTPRERVRAAAALWPYAAGVAAFAGYWLWHGSVSLSRSEAQVHPDFSFHSGNLFLMLFLVGAFFVPLLPAWLSRYAAAARVRPALLALPILLGVLYATTFRVDHPYNLYEPDFYLRNALLVYVAQHRWAFTAFGAVAVIAGCAVSQVRWQRPAFVLLLPVSALLVSASWLIEQRYYLIPVALLLALRVRESRRAERVMLAWWMPVAVGLLYLILNRSFFL